MLEKNDMLIQEEPHNIVILGGTFDPIHYGHIESAKHVATWLGVNKVTLIPSHIPPHKNKTSATAKHRANMVKIICDIDPIFSYDDRELERNTPSFTVDTLKEIKQETPNSRIFFIIGMDSLLNFTQWNRWPEILSLCHLVVNSRPDYYLEQYSLDTKALLAQYQSTDLSQLMSRNSNLFGSISFAPSISYCISSTHIRFLLKKQDNCQSFLPQPLLDYINHHQLYR